MDLPAAAPLIPPATPGRHKVPKQIAGYRLIGKLGQGGMAAVFKAQQVAMDRIVALKVLAPAQIEDRNQRTRFMREARLIGRIQHQNVITCYEVGEHDGYLFMALEFAEQGDVLALARSLGGILPERLALGMLLDCANGLNAIHRAGLLHRDLKPANIFLFGQLQAKLADLGIAKEMRRLTDSDQSGAHTIIGSPAYMPPEQVLGGKPDARSDIYALGAGFFQLLTGRLPFPGTTAHETLSLVMKQPTPDPAKLVPTLSPGIAALIRRAMSKEPDQRQASAVELLDDVERLIESGRDDKPAAAAAQPAPLDYANGVPAALVRCRF
jgi:eukaryotic-like serine/threonine-protein kinase